MIQPVVLPTASNSRSIADQHAHVSFVILISGLILVSGSVIRVSTACSSAQKSVAPIPAPRSE
jgi:hypothetical protein